MTIYFLFGKTGTGKTYVGDLLSKYTGLRHIDGDKAITDRMREALQKEVPITRDMIDAFVLKLRDVIQGQMHKSPEISFIISQAMYMNEHRQILLDSFGEAIELILIESDEATRKKRILSRHEEGKSQVTMDCAKEMDTHFERPNHPYHQLMNNGNNQALIEGFQALRSVNELEDNSSHLEKPYYPSVSNM